MPKGTIKSSTNSSKKLRPALSPENEEGQCISLAISLVKKRLMEGTASSQETTHFLRMASTETRLKNELIKTQQELMQARIKSIESEERKEALFTEAIEAMKRYSGNSDYNDEEPY